MYNSSAPMAWRRIKQRNCLIGSECNECKTLFYPPKLKCKKCSSSSNLSEFKFSGKGSIVSFSEIRNPLYGFEKQTPYTIAIVKLEEGPMLTTQIVDFDKIEIGTKVESCLRVMHTEGHSGMIQYGTKFKPAE